MYYKIEGDRLYYGSEIKSILAAGVKGVLDKAQLQNYFVFKYSPGNETLFQGIRRVPQGSVLTYDLEKGQVEIKKFWEPTKDEALAKLNYKDAKALTYELMEDAVRLRLIADVPVATFLSGGLDSSIIAHFLKGNHQIQHYTAVKSAAAIKAEGTTDDAGYARKLPMLGTSS